MNLKKRLAIASGVLAAVLVGTEAVLRHDGRSLMDMIDGKVDAPPFYETDYV